MPLLPETIEARKQKVIQCGADIEEVLKKHDCTMFQKFHKAFIPGMNENDRPISDERWEIAIITNDELKEMKNGPQE